MHNDCDLNVLARSPGLNVDIGMYTLRFSLSKGLCSMESWCRGTCSSSAKLYHRRIDHYRRGSKIGDDDSASKWRNYPSVFRRHLKTKAGVRAAKTTSCPASQAASHRRPHNRGL